MSRLLAKDTHDQTPFARQLRQAGNPAEKLLWSKLRRRQFFGLKFRKQVPIGPYIVDFLCAQKRIVVEIDGDSHHETGRQEKDEKRDAYLAQRNLTVMRIGHRETLQNVDGVLENIRLLLGLEYT
ncbi:DNA methyltransferase [Candidatus Peregrinibacteria bacterium CG22_combo_CG10-13_8_21_14_all_49_11]|nr:MAG: DNA methyltransferase [Candidatus Peregrinibacteria bacterium CG22_combo_CG10-13_8_21_14_all_49_11]